MNLRDHLFAKAPDILGDKEVPADADSANDLVSTDGGFIESKHDEEHHVPESGFERILGSGPDQALRPLVGTLEEGGVIDPDVLWSCTTCGGCVEQCPVDIEHIDHIDHIVDMRRYQVMVASEFPGELGVLFKNLEQKGNPRGQSNKVRTAWINEVDFDVPVFGEDVDSFEDFEYLFYVGCAGAFEDRAKKTTKAVAELLSVAGVKFWCWARPSPATATRPGARAMNSCSSSSRRRPRRPSTAYSKVSRAWTARSSSPARTASTRWAASTSNSAPATRCCTTLSC
jgi:Fe-S oxidoreductase